MIRKRMVESAKECMKHRATKSEIYGKMQEVFIEMDSSPVVSFSNKWLLPTSIESQQILLTYNVFLNFFFFGFQHTVTKELEQLKDAVMKGDNEENTEGEFDPAKHIDANLPVRVNEQRLSNLLQSLLLGASLLAMPVIKKIPTSVLWGYFAYMAIDSLPGNQFWERMLLLFVTPGRRYKYEIFICS